MFAYWSGRPLMAVTTRSAPTASASALAPGATPSRSPSSLTTSSKRVWFESQSPLWSAPVPRT